ncbi:MAG: hypothetical protein LBF24_02275 [Puniceicoccales bacterium]|jgi:hypothetical protein|nr:hypothetical protein [Puniceicoccales bacterium]
MSVPVVTLRSAFPDALQWKSFVGGDALLAMVCIWDTLNESDAYYLDPRVVEDATKQTDFDQDGRGGYQIYVRTYNKDTGEMVYQAVRDLDSFISDSVSLFLGRKADDSYMDIYSLYHLRTNKIFCDHGGASFLDDRYADLTMRIVAVLYSLSCRQKRIMEQYIRDIDAVAAEQRLTQRLADVLKAVQSMLTQKDSGIQDVENMHGATLPAEVWAYFVSRDLVNFSCGDSAFVGIDENAILKVIYGPQDDTGLKIGYGAVDSFKAWTQFNALLRHGELFLPDYAKPENRIVLPDALRNVAVADPYDTVYWYRSIDLDENAFKGTIGTGDHWVFDPRLRDSEGNILNWAGGIWDGAVHPAEADNCAFFPGFGTVGGDDLHGGMYNFTGNASEDRYSVFDRKEEDSADHTKKWSWENEQVVGAGEPPTPDFSVRWYGVDAPSNAQEFEGGTGEILSRCYGRERFLPAECFTITEGAVAFSPFFKNFLKCASVPYSDSSSAYSSFSMVWKLNNDNSRAYFAVRKMALHDPSDDAQQPDASATNDAFSGSYDDENGTLTACQFRSVPKSPEQNPNNVSIDYWPVPDITPTVLHETDGDDIDGIFSAYHQCVLQPIRSASATLVLTSDKVLAIADSLRMRSQQVNGDGNTRSARLQQAQQAAQQALSVCASLMSAINRNRFGTTGNIRI